MIFLSIINEPLVQVNDKTRLDASKCFANGGDTITLIEIDPDSTGTFTDITDDGFLDWAYDANGDYEIELRVNSTLTKKAVVKVLTEAEDNLFSKDSDITPYEPDLLKWVQDGRSSFLDKHRIAQVEILNELDSNQIWKRDGSRYEAVDIVDIQDFKEWSKFTTLRIIFDGISNEVADVFYLKARKYESMSKQSMKRACLRLDSDGDGEIGNTEKTNIISGSLRRVI